MDTKRRGWLIVFVSTLIIFCSIGMTTATFSIYIPYFLKNYGYTNSQTSLLVSIRTMASFFCMFTVTKYFTFFSIRTGMALALLGSVVGFSIMASTSYYPLLCFCAFLLGSTYTFASMYPLTLLMNRWFGDRSTVPLSISSCGSGVAAVVCPTVITYVIEGYSLSTAFYMDAVVLALAAVMTFTCIKNSPDEASSAGKAQSKDAPPAHKFRSIPKLHFHLLMLAISFNGALTLAGWGHFAVLFRTNGYSSMEIAYALSLGGFTLMVSKFFYGFITERIHTFKSNFVFATLLNCAFLLSGLLPLGYSWTPTLMTLCCGLGAPISTLGVCMWAKEVSSPEAFPDNLRKLQTCHPLGGLVFSNIPGVLADLTGSYIPSYFILSAVGMISFFIIQSIYIKNKLYDLH